ncbi:hemin uptake protein HemP [Tropicimonas sp. S265A]|uniref:hemin uptake protein HemP n=1 Tax=Tropicimonas sp. S265A TaxID=3415134 RepID=UPI003C7E7FFF
MTVRPKPTPAPTAPPCTPTTPAYDARSLVDPDGKALLVLDTQTYTLKITRNNKLILTK